MSLKLFMKDPVSKELVINPLKHNTFPYWLCTDPPNTVAVVAAAGASNEIPMTVTQEGPFEGFAFVGQRTNPVNVVIEDRASKKSFMNRMVHLDTILGGTSGAAGDADLGLKPYILPQTIFLHQRRSLTVNFTDIGVAGSNVRFAIAGRRFYPAAAGSPELAKFIEKKIKRYAVAMPYFLTTDNPAAFLGAGVQTFRMSVGSDGHFVGYKVSYVSTLAGGDPTIYFSDAETGRIIMNGVPNAGIMQAADSMGTGHFPMVFAEPWFIERNGGINLTIQAFGAGTLFVTIAGIKLYVA